jgi:O-acetyl-ADP-ribose deacetylase (regulator of RNase III)
MTVVQADITEQEVDAIVTAVSEALRGVGGVDGADAIAV